MAEKIGRYEVKKELGRGGMATVYLAYDPRFQREVAIKVLPPQFTHDPRFLALFEQEAQTIAALEDPAIVPVYDFGEHDHSPYIVMRYMPGGSLRDKLGGKPLPLSQITAILQRLAPALDEAHRRGVIHRDIKPDNVLFDHKNRPYLADFGIARMAEATQTMTIVGTPSYMSPEQVQGKQKLDWRSDLYALGVTLFEMVTGRKPYEAETPSGQMFMHVMEPIPDVQALNRELPPGMQEVIARAMAKDRRERYQSAREMVEGVASLRAVGGELPASKGSAALAGEAVLVGIEEWGGQIEGEEAESPEDGADRKEVKIAEAQASAVQETDHEPLPVVEPALPADQLSAMQAPPIDRPPLPYERGAARAGLPGWIWWVGVAVGLVILILGIRAAFLGGMKLEPEITPVDNGSTPTLESNEAAPPEFIDTPTPLEPTDTFTPPQGEAVTGDCSSEEVFCIGLVTDVGQVDDKSFNQAAWEGAQQAAEELGAQVEYIETQDAKDYASNIALFAEDGYDVIVTVGFAMGEATGIAAAQYPDIKFIGIDQFQAEETENLAGLIFNEDKSGFLAGALAAMLTETNTVAAVLGTDLVPPVVAFKEGYEGGVEYINPDVNVISTYHPGGLDVAFTDPEWGASTARQAIDQGADVVFAAGGNTGNGGLIEAAGVDGVWCIGVDSDQWFTVPEAHPCLVSSAMKLITPGVVDLLTMAANDEMPSGNFFGGAGLAPFHDHEDAVPQEVKDRLAEIDAGLQDGSIQTGYNPGG